MVRRSALRESRAENLVFFSLVEANRFCYIILMAVSIRVVYRTVEAINIRRKISKVENERIR